MEDFDEVRDEFQPLVCIVRSVARDSIDRDNIC